MGFEYNERTGECISLELYWRLLFPEFAVPRECYLRGWLKRTSIDDVFLLLDQLQGQHRRRRPFQSAEHLGRTVSSMIYQIANGEMVKTYPEQVSE